MDAHVDVQSKRVVVLGLAFKPGTDDVRNSRSTPIIEGLKQRGAEVVAYDNIGYENMQGHFSDIEYADTPAAAINGSPAALIITDWEEITALNEEVDAMATPVVVDGRGAISRRDGIVYEGLSSWIHTFDGIPGLDAKINPKRMQTYCAWRFPNRPATYQLFLHFVFKILSNKLRSLYQF